MANDHIFDSKQHSYFRWNRDNTFWPIYWANNEFLVTNVGSGDDFPFEYEMLTPANHDGDTLVSVLFHPDMRFITNEESDRIIALIEGESSIYC